MGTDLQRGPIADHRPAVAHRWPKAHLLDASATMQTQLRPGSVPTRHRDRPHREPLARMLRPRRASRRPMRRRRPSLVSSTRHELADIGAFGKSRGRAGARLGVRSAARRSRTRCQQPGRGKTLPQARCFVAREVRVGRSVDDKGQVAVEALVQCSRTLPRSLDQLILGTPTHLNCHACMLAAVHAYCAGESMSRRIANRWSGP